MILRALCEKIQWSTYTELIKHRKDLTFYHRAFKNYQLTHGFRCYGAGLAEQFCWITTLKILTVAMTMRNYETEDLKVLLKL